MRFQIWQSIDQRKTPPCRFVPTASHLPNTGLSELSNSFRNGRMQGAQAWTRIEADLRRHAARQRNSSTRALVAFRSFGRRHSQELEPPDPFETALQLPRDRQNRSIPLEISAHGKSIC
jgi:hypothetical protein